MYIPVIYDNAILIVYQDDEEERLIATFTDISHAQLFLDCVNALN